MWLPGEPQNPAMQKHRLIQCIAVFFKPFHTGIHFLKQHSIETNQTLGDLYIYVQCNLLTIFWLLMLWLGESSNVTQDMLTC